LTPAQHPLATLTSSKRRQQAGIHDNECPLIAMALTGQTNSPLYDVGSDHLSTGSRVM
jgi:hypothetical protein